MTPTGWSLHHHLVRRFVSVEPALAERVNALAAAEGIPVSAWLSRAVLESANLHSGARKRGSRRILPPILPRLSLTRRKWRVDGDYATSGNR